MGMCLSVQYSICSWFRLLSLYKQRWGTSTWGYLRLSLKSEISHIYQENKYFEYFIFFVFLPNLKVIDWITWTSSPLTLMQLTIFTKWELMIKSNLSSPIKLINFVMVSPTKIIGAWMLRSSNLTSSRLLTTSYIISSLLVSTISTLRTFFIIGSSLISSTILISGSSFITRP